MPDARWSMIPIHDRADQPLHVRRIARLTGCGLGPTQRELQLLAQIGVIKRQTIYQQNLNFAA